MVISNCNLFVHILKDLLIDSKHQIGSVKQHTESSQTSRGIEIRESASGSVSIIGATQVTVTSQADVESVAARGQANRAMSSTKCNAESSRSHMVLMIDVEVREAWHMTLTPMSSSNATPVDPNASIGGRVLSAGRISLVDLAGSERIAKSEVTGSALTEAKHINKSLSALIDVISALSEREKREKMISETRDRSNNKNSKEKKIVDPEPSSSSVGTKRSRSSMLVDAVAADPESQVTTNTETVHIPFRNSKLTHLLMGSLKPGSKLVFIAQVLNKRCNKITIGLFNNICI